MKQTDDSTEPRGHRQLLAFLPQRELHGEDDVIGCHLAILDTRVLERVDDVTCLVSVILTVYPGHIYGVRPLMFVVDAFCCHDGLYIVWGRRWNTADQSEFSIQHIAKPIFTPIQNGIQLYQFFSTKYTRSIAISKYTAWVAKAFQHCASPKLVCSKHKEHQIWNTVFTTVKIARFSNGTAQFLAQYGKGYYDHNHDNTASQPHLDFLQHHTKLPFKDHTICHANKWMPLFLF